MPDDLTALAEENYCYLTTLGRVSGEPREIEIWFGLDGTTLYMLSGGRDRSDWVKNLMREPRVSVRIGDRTFEGDARVVSDPDEDKRARALVYEKYAPGYSGDLEDWRERSLPSRSTCAADGPLAPGTSQVRAKDDTLGNLTPP